MNETRDLIIISHKKYVFSSNADMSEFNTLYMNRSPAETPWTLEKRAYSPKPWTIPLNL